MTQTQMDKLVTASELSRQLGIPIPTIYRMAERQRIPFVDETRPWHERRFYRFDPAEVCAVLGIEQDRQAS
jgi:excisionase family DNA binding protein